MSFNLFSVPTLFSAIIMGYIGVYVLLLNPSSKVFRAFLLFCFSGVGWLLGFSLVYLSKSPTTALFWSNLTFISIAFIPTTNLYFNFCLIDANVKNKVFTPLLFFTSLFFAITGYKTSLIYSSIHLFFWG